MPKRVAIIGGGPAGMSCALWLHHLKLHPFIIEQSSQLGGLQRSNPYINAWFLGCRDVTGEVLANRFTEHMAQENISVTSASSFTHIERAGTGFTLHIDTDAKITPTYADAVVIATGTRFRTSEAHQHIAGFDHVTERIIYLPVPTEQIDYYHGNNIAIIGGGDNAFETAIFLSDAVAHIDLIVRSKPRAQTGFTQEIERLQQQGKCTLHTDTSIERFDRANHQVHISLSSGQTILVDDILSRTGYIPNSEHINRLCNHDLNEHIALDRNGYIMIDDRHRTSISGIYAAGDIANPVNPCVATAIGQGTIAARTIEYDFRES